MAIAKFMLEALGEGAFLQVLKKAWGWAKKIWLAFGIGASAKDEISKRLVGSKGWEDENFFALDLAEANLSADKKKMICDAVRMVEQYDDVSGTQWAKNFRIIVTIRDREPSPAGIRSGTIILQDLGSTCNSVQEVFCHIIAFGISQDPSSTLEKFINFSKTSVWPFISEKAGGVRDALDSGVTRLENLRRDIEEDERTEMIRVSRIADPKKRVVAKAWNWLSKYIFN